MLQGATRNLLHYATATQNLRFSRSASSDPDRTLDILIGQLVNLVRDGQPVRMSKRAGTVVLLDDIVDAIGVDAARYSLARFDISQSIDIDVDLWSSRRNDNPVYYV